MYKGEMEDETIYACDTRVEEKLYLPLRHNKDLILLSFSLLINRVVSIRMYIPDKQRTGYAKVDDLITLDKGGMGISILEKGFCPDTHDFYENKLEYGEELEQYGCRKVLPTKNNINFVLNDILERVYNEKFNIDFVKDFCNSKKNVWYCNKELTQVINEEQLEETLKQITGYRMLDISCPYLKNKRGDFYKVIHFFSKNINKAFELTNLEIKTPLTTYSIGFYKVIKKKQIFKGQIKINESIDVNSKYTLTFNTEELIHFLKDNHLESYMEVSKYK